MLTYPGVLTWAQQDAKVLTQVDGHYCYEWDGMPVSAFTIEYAACIDFKKTRLGKFINWFVQRRFNWTDPTIRWWQIWYI